MQLEDVLSWRCGHPQMRGAVPGAAKDGDTEMPDLQLDALASLDRHAGRYSAFSDEEDEDELHSLYLVRARLLLSYCKRTKICCPQCATHWLALYQATKMLLGGWAHHAQLKRPCCVFSVCPG